MDQNSKPQNSGSPATESNAPTSRPASKWAAIINDQNIPAPERMVKVSVLKAQADIPEDHTLFRDCSPSQDVPFGSKDVLDLAEGNVFYSREGCFAPSASPCNGRAKLGWFVDDRHEITLLPHQTGESIRELFSLNNDHCLLQDFDSPNDKLIAADAKLEFANGPVFITRCDGSQPKEITIIVNTRKKTVSKKTLTFEDVVRLAFDKPPTGANICITVTYRRGPACNPQGTMVQGGKPVEIQNGMIFDVTATDKS